MRNYQKKIAIFFVAVISFGFFMTAAPNRVKADFGFDQICTIAMGGLAGGINGLLSAAMSSGAVEGLINKAETWVKDKLPSWAKGVFGSNPVPTNDTKMNAEEKLKNCAQTILTRYANLYARTFINKTLAKYKIANYAVYTLNLANQVYVAHQIKNQSIADQFLVRENINRILKRTASSVDLKAIYQKRSLTAVNFQAAKTADIFKSSAFAVFDDPLVSTPQGQAYMSEAGAREILASAQQAANIQVLTGQGQKDQLKKTNSTKVLGATTSDPTIDIPTYEVQTPGSNVGASINSTTQNLCQQDLRPQDKSSIIGTYAAQYLESLGGPPKTDCGQVNPDLNKNSGDLETDFQAGFDTSSDTTGLFDTSGNFLGN
jgi:hypothetical protein